MAVNNSLSGTVSAINTEGVRGAEPVSNKEIMAEARASLSGNWGVVVLGYFLFQVFICCFFIFIGVVTCSVALRFFSVECQDLMNGIVPMAINGASVLTSGAIAVGICRFFLGIAQENEARPERFFCGVGRFWRSLFSYILMTLFVSLWTLLLIIPGIIAVYSYSMTFFVLADNEDCGPLEAISRSKKMMKGNKWKFFCLNWRFFWWALLANLFLGIGWLWLLPYMQTSFAQFYEDIS